MVEVWHVLTFLVGLVSFLYILARYQASYWEKRGILTMPFMPLIGHVDGIIMQKDHVLDVFQRFYKTFPDEKYLGVHQVDMKVILVKDVDLIKQITIKDYEYFMNHHNALVEDVDYFFGKTVFALAGQKWRDMRATMSPAFTSSKMKGMFEYVAEIGEQMADFYVKQMEKPENKAKGMVHVEMKDAFARYANDVIASVAFAHRVDSLAERENEFFMVGQDMTSVRGLRFLIFLVSLKFPRLIRFLNLSMFDEKRRNFFRNLVWSAVGDRNKHNFSRNDVIQLLMQIKAGVLKYDKNDEEQDTGFATVEESAMGQKDVKRKWSDDSIAAQAVIFFIAGYETSSTLLSLLTYELALNPDIQKRLQDEVDEVALKNDGKVLYTDLHSMKYMDMVVSEALRKWPPATATDRKCTKAYELPSPNPNRTDKTYWVKPGDPIYIPIYAIHHDPNFFPNPTKFDPERFSDENKKNIKPGTFFPFGSGPRNCLGSRFALMETKGVIFHLLHKFDILQTEKTQVPLQLQKGTFNVQATKGFWMGLRPRY